MRAVEFACKEVVAIDPALISEHITDVNRWTEFSGYGLIPGISKAEYELRTESQIGSRVRVRNTDGSGHTEEFMAWVPGEHALIRMSDFSPPLKWFATHFFEEWTLVDGPDGTSISRRFSLQPKHGIGRVFLSLIAPLLRRAVSRHLSHMKREADLKSSVGRRA